MLRGASMTRLRTISRSRGQSRQAESEFLDGPLMVLTLSLHAFDVGFHAIEAFLPGGDMLAYPRVGRMKGARLDLAGSNAPDFLGADEPALLKSAQMLEQRRQSQFERLGQFADGFRSIAQAADDGPPGRVGERGKGS